MRQGDRAPGLGAWVKQGKTRLFISWRVGLGRGRHGIVGEEAHETSAKGEPNSSRPPVWMSLRRESGAAPDRIDG